VDITNTTAVFKPISITAGLSPSPSPVTTAPAVQEFLAKMRAQPRARLILALDATASRQPTWDRACELQAQMFAAVPIGIEVQLVYFSGTECTASRWHSSAAALTAVMRKIVCMAGLTQIGRVLGHVRRENSSQKVSALFFVGDCCEESRSELYAEARELNVPAFFFQEGDDAHTGGIFAELAKITKGAYATFDASAAQTLGDLVVGAWSRATTRPPPCSHRQARLDHQESAAFADAVRRGYAAVARRRSPMKVGSQKARGGPSGDATTSTWPRRTGLFLSGARKPIRFPAVEINGKCPDPLKEPRAPTASPGLWLGLLPHNRPQEA
jgi:hypothetical protein